MALTKVTYSMIQGASINVNDYGAVGDGVTNDTTALQNAINAAANGVVDFIGSSSTVFLINATLSIPSNTTLRFSPGVTIKLANAANCAILKNSDFVGGNTNINVIGGIFDANKSNQTVSFNTIDLNNLSNSKFLGIFVNGGYTVGYINYGTINVETCNNILFEDCELTAAGSEGLYLKNSTYCTVRGGKYYDNTNGSGVASTGTGGYHTISEVHAYNNAGSNFSINTQYTYMSGCISEQSTLNGITLGHPSYPASYSKVIGCISKNNGATGIAVLGTSTDVEIIGNTVSSNTATNFSGISSSDNSVRTVIQSNKVIGNYFGIFVLGGTEGIIVSDNFVSDSINTGITLSNTSNALVVNNISKNNASGGTGYGIYVWNTSTKNVISGNSCFDDQGSPTQQRGIYINNHGNVFGINQCWGNTVTQTTLSGNVASLAPATDFKGGRNFVIDATATTFGSIVSGGGTNAVPVYSDGTDWRIG